ncbi:MAG: type II toxin-antitoxin system VapC family toxin [Candidatus Hydrothermarchaeota archaeon]
MRFIDTNLFLYKMLGKPKDKYRRSSALIERVEEGKERCATSSIIIAEIVWVLETVNWKMSRIKELIEAIFELKGLKILDTPGDFFPLDAVKLATKTGVDYVDALNSLTMQKYKIREIYSFDRHFDRINFITRLEPPLVE